jgi:hypothetical protein
MGKGSKQRPTNTKAFDANYDAIFNKREEKPMTQNERIFNYMKDNKFITAREALIELGVYRLASRIAEMIKDGIVIEKKRVTVKNKFKESCSIIQYSLGE